MMTRFIKTCETSNLLFAKLACQNHLLRNVQIIRNLVLIK